MNSPKIFFNSPLVKTVQKIVDARGSWSGMTIPEGAPEACAILAAKMPVKYVNVKKVLMLLSTIKAGIYFTDSKPKVKQWLFKHEMYHWERAQGIGGIQYLELLGGQYLLYGHDNAPEEKAANKYGKSGANTTFEQNAWDASN